MPAFGKSSMQRHKTLHPRLQEVMDEAIKVIDFSIVAGHRGEKEQNAAYLAGNSKVKYPNSKHNVYPSNAVDIVPWPTQYSCSKQIYLLAGVVLGIAHKKGITLRWGGDWNGNGDLTDQTLDDPYHFELAE